MSRFTLEAKVGALFLAAIAIFAYVWFKVLDFNLREGSVLKARFKSVEGVAKDSQVQMAGIRIGKVRDIQYDPEAGKAVVVMEINDTYKNAIPEGSRISLKSKGILGDKFVVIEPGKPNARKLKAGEEVEMVQEAPDTEKVLENMSVIAQDLQVLTKEARKQVIDEKGSKKVDNIITNADTVFSDLKDLLGRNKDRLNRTIENAESATGDLSQIAGRNKEKINRAVDEMEKFSKSMDKTSDKFGRVATEMEALTNGIRSGKGTMGKLVVDETLYRDAQFLMRDLRGLANNVQYGQGTVSRLLNDPDIYFEARRAIRNMNKTAEDVSDATPISTLATILGVVLK
jgi:phospholipid/cholesterol/gamma-HCH transport system substrate-binding protein